MKVPYSWLADWVELSWDARELGSRLTMAGFELEALEAAAPPFAGVVVGEILSAERHPQADKLQVCRVAVGGGEPVQIVCGAANARAGLKSALAIVGARLPGDLEIGAARLRGVESCGMLASAKELGLADASAGILELPADAPVGRSLRDYLQLDEPVLEIAVTPNRGDAMSIIGIAREVAALSGKPLKAPRFDGVPDPAGTLAGNSSDALRDIVTVHLDVPGACPVFAGRIIRALNNRAVTPLWLSERLRRAGVRSISPVVDVTNYVMLELGQPMHAYDLGKLRGAIRVRLAREGEAIKLLDGKSIQAQADVLLITDADGPIGLAGIMGGERTAVSAATTDVFFEAAWFAPQAVIGRARRWGYVTDASQRFERGVDPTQQRRAMLRATSLLRASAGGAAGPIHLKQSSEHLPRRLPVPLRRQRLTRLLGISLADDRVESTLSALQMAVSGSGKGWEVTPPAHRFDIAIEADLIEEVARIVGFESIPESDAVAPQQFPAMPEERAPEQVVLETLASCGYHEQITFAFVDPVLQSRLFPDGHGLMLSNPIASDLSVMRLSLWPGLLTVARENQRRQQDRIRLFEHGARFVTGAGAEGATREINSIAAVALGARLPEQWAVPVDARGAVDFFDVKADLERLLEGTGARQSFTFQAPADGSGLSCLHPGRAARVLRGGQEVGWIGELHPSLVKALDFTYVPVLFELEMQALTVKKPQYREISRFPQVRRDLAVVVDEAIPLSALAERVTLSASSLLQHFRVFDVYRGPGVESGRKSVAFGLIFQDISRTLTDDDMERLMATIVADLRVALNARIRE
ncbi:MAG TPA: phenylalanine--tRNA ligase subunit beta [Steroidobacteraceae bacterium]